MVQSEAAPARSFEPLIEVAMSAQAFSAHWAQCGHIATYLARAVSHNRTDSTLYSNLFSSAVNELLELAYRSHRGDGLVQCRVLRREEVDRIEISIPSDASRGRFLMNAVEQLSGPESEARYLSALTSESGYPDVGLLELALDYGASISARAEGAEQIRLTVDLRLEDQGPL